MTDEWRRASTLTNSPSFHQFTLLELSFLDLAILLDALADPVQLVVLEIAFFSCAVWQDDFTDAIELIV